MILLSTRADAATWWTSASATNFGAFRTDDVPHELRPFRDMWHAIARNTFTEDFLDAAMASYDAHNAAVRAEADPARVVDWQPGDGWTPICEALGLSVPGPAVPTRTRRRSSWAGSANHRVET